ncbi:MAG: transporter substrate-binding domain-containing protein [Pseudomonadota bacterium]
MKRNTILSAFAVGGVALTGFLSDMSIARAQSAITCGASYTVVPGDSLSQIADRAYGDASSFQLIYTANSVAIGPSPELISVGLVLDIPCADGATESAADASVIRTVATTEALPAPVQAQIRVVVGTDWAPFTDEGQEQGGMAVEITNRALEIADGGPDYKIDFINDWGAHLRPLVTDHAYDFSIAWFRPNCDVVDRLGDGSKFRCNNLDWSEPIFEQVVGYYMRAGEANPASHQDLYGKVLCRPAGYATFMMEEHGLVAPNITHAAPNGPTECFDGLLSGEYDAVILAADVAEGVIAKLSAKDKVVFQDNLSYIATMHAVIAKTNPNKEAYLAAIDDGLGKMKSSGEWFQIVSRHLSEHYAQAQ